MLSQLNLISKLFGSAWHVLPGLNLTTVSKRRAMTGAKDATRPKDFRPPPWQATEGLSRHLLRDIGVDRSGA